MIRQIKALLAEHADQLASGSIDGYLQADAPGARPLERQLAESSKAAPVTGQSFVLNESSISETELPVLAARVDLLYLYKGLQVDDQFRLALNLGFETVQDKLRISTANLQAGAKAPFWAAGPTDMFRSPHFLALYRSAALNPGPIIAAAEQARAELAKKLALAEGETQLIIIARNNDEFDATSSADAPLSTVAQAEASVEVTPAEIKVRGRQIIVNAAGLQREGGAIETLTHELGHLALAKDTRPFTPAWVSEGAAMYLAGTRPKAAWQAGTRQGQFDKFNLVDLSRASQLGGHGASGYQTTLEYAYSAAAAWYLVETFGADRLWQFYKSFAALPAAEVYRRLPAYGVASSKAEDQQVANLAAETADRGLRSIFGLSETELDTRIKDWMKKQF